MEGRRRHSIVLLLCVDDVYAGGLFLSEFRVVCYVPCGGHRFGTTEIGAAAARLTGPVAVPLCPGVLPPSEQDRLSNKQLAQVLIGVSVVYVCLSMCCTLTAMVVVTNNQRCCLIWI